MTLEELAKKYDISDVHDLHRLINRADEAVERWEEAQPIGDDSLDELTCHIGRIRELLEDKQNWAALTNRGHYDGFSRADLMGALDELELSAAMAHEPRKRGPQQKKIARAVVREIAFYWVGDLNRQFTQDWHAGEPVSAAARFAYDVMMMVAPENIGELPRAMMEKVAALQVSRK